MRSTWLVLAAAGVGLALPRPADACSALPCWPGAFVPGDQGRVPANVHGLYWRPMTGLVSDSKPENVILEDVAAPGAMLALTAQPLANGDYLLVPSAPLVDGKTYRLTDRTTCMIGDAKGPQVTFAVGPAATPPVSLGTLSAAAPAVVQMELATTTGSCSAKATVAQSAIELDASPSATAWLDVLHFETRVDGKPWHYQSTIRAMTPPGESARGRARDLVFEVCSTQDSGVGEGLTAGVHTVTMQATLPGTSDVVTSTELTVSLDCNQVEHMPETGGCNAGGPGAAAGAAMALLALARSVRPRGRAGSAHRRR
ncbi:MAG: hypothetical protein ACREBE_15725 [bacterium]